MNKKKSRLNHSSSSEKSSIDFQIILDNITDAVFYLIPDNNNNFFLEYANQPFYKKSGLKPEEVIGKKIQDIIPEIDLKTGKEKLKDAISGKKNVEWKMSTNLFSGVKVSLICIVPEFDENQKCSNIVVTFKDITKQEYSEKSISETEERWKFALEGAGDGVWDWNAQTNEVFFSKQWKKMLGYEENEIENTLDEWDKRVHPDDKEKVYADLNNHFEGKTPFYINEHRVLCKDGTYKWILDRGKVMQQSKDGKPLRVIGTHSDISDRKKTENEIKALSNILENSLNEIYIFDSVTLKFLYANNGALKNLKFTQNEILKLAPWDIKPEITKKTFLNIIKPLLNGEKEIVNFETIHQRKDGSTYAVDVHVQLSDFKNHKVFVAIILDISEIKLAEKRLRESQQYNRMLFVESQIGLAVTNMDGKLVDINAAYAKIIGYTIEEILQLTYWDITPEKYFHKEQEQLESLMKNGFYGPYEKEYIHKKGHLVPVRLNGKIIEEKGEKYIWSSVEDITELKNAETLLKESEKRFEQIMQSVHLVSVILERDATLSYCNDYFLELTGYLHNEVIGKNWFDLFIPPEIKNEFKSVFNDAISKNKFISYRENEIVTKSGKHLTIAWNNTTLNNKKGEIIGIASLGEDISKRLIAEKALQLNEERFRLISSLTSDYLFTSEINNEGKLVTTWVFGAFEKMTGYTFDEFQKQGGWRASLHPEDVEKDERDLEILNSNKKVVTEIRTIKKSGEIIWNRVYAQPVWDEINQKLSGIYGAVQDITENKNAQTALETSEIKYKSLVEQSLTGIYIFEKSNYLYVNKRFCEIFGYSEKEILSNMKPTDVISIEDRERADENVKKRLAGEVKSVHYIAKGNHKTGKLLWVEIHGTHLEIEGKDVITGTVLDITDRKIAEEKIIKLNEELEEKIRERTSDLELKITEIERMNRLFVGRELRMKELKEKIKELEEELGNRNQ